MPTQPLVVVLGGTGQLGGALVDELRRSGRAWSAPSRAELDLLQPGAIDRWLDAVRASAVVNAAAYTDVVGAESAEAQAQVQRLNREAPDELARACQKRGLALVHVSTDYVFDGRGRRPYREDDATAPIQVYGRSKLEGERAVVEACPGALVVRTSTLFGRAVRTRRNYVEAVLHQARQSRPALDLVRLPVGSPTYAADLALAVLQLLERGASGTVHGVNRGACSRIELAQEALRLAGFAAVELRERLAPTEGPCRPAYSALDPGRCEELIGRPMPSWQAGLAAYLRDG